MAGGIYRNPIMFSIVAAAAIMVGTFVTMFFPMMTPQMHPKLEALEQYSPLELMGKDIYQREGCFYCHTQTVRPLKTEVMRYGEYSKAGEFAFDRPFLWGSKRTGPDLARVGLRLPAPVLYAQMKDPRASGKKSNMPAYAWLEDRALDPDDIKARMDAQGFEYEGEDISSLEGRNELEALVSYMLWLGHAVKPAKAEASVHVSAGEPLFSQNCSGCHGANGSGGAGPSLMDNVWLAMEGDISDEKLASIITGGTAGGMPPYEGAFSDEQLHDLVDFIRSLSGGGAGASAEGSLGAEVYAGNCAGCHGADATGGFGPDLTDNVWLGQEGDVSEDRLEEIISKGTAAGMPPFGDALKHDDLDAVVSFIMGL
jgi:cytochrome c oxidase cbb3-type subunit 2